MITAINKKHQKNVNKFVQWDEKYNAAVDANAANDCDTCTKQERAYEKAITLFQELPKREQDNLRKNMDCVGY